MCVLLEIPRRRDVKHQLKSIWVDSDSNILQPII